MCVGNFFLVADKANSSSKLSAEGRASQCHWPCVLYVFFQILFLAHLSRRLKMSLYDGLAPASVRPSVRRPSVVHRRRPSTISKIFSSETAWSIKAKLHV